MTVKLLLWSSEATDVTGLAFVTGLASDVEALSALDGTLEMKLVTVTVTVSAVACSLSADVVESEAVACGEEASSGAVLACKEVSGNTVGSGAIEDSGMTTREVDSISGMSLFSGDRGSVTCVVSGSSEVKDG